jgi:hypothetical protein
MVARLIRPLDTDAQSWSLDITWLDPQFLPYDRDAYWRGPFSATRSDVGVNFRRYDTGVDPPLLSPGFSLFSARCGHDVHLAGQTKN